jgi:protein involved in polysaccharide export with SLBB domain
LPNRNYHDLSNFMMYNFKKAFACFVLLFLSFTSIESYAQNAPQTVLAQVQAMLNSKGLNETDVKARLKSKGLDVEKMSQEDLIKNRAEIEKTISEMEAEKNSGKTASVENAGVKEGKDLGVAPKEKLELVSADMVPTSKVEILADKLQEKVADKLPASAIYGHSIFREKSIEVYRVSKDASPPESYILSPGDKINVLIFGKSQADLSYEINTAGFISPNLMPKIFLGGLTLKQAKDLLISRFSSYYVFNRDQFALILNTSRTLSINIFGEVEKVGTYTTSALNTALNALSVSGGPTEIGTVRNIQIIRGNTKKVLDVYAFMTNPIVQFEFFLQNNDIIYVPAAEKVVTLEGAVNRPMRYELKTGEGLKELIGFAGGLRVDAFTEIVQVQRIENNKVVLNDYSFTDVLNGKIKLELMNGDVVKLKLINAPLMNYVRVNGAVNYAGDYALSTTSTISALLQKAKLKPEAKKEQAFLLRKKLDQTTEVISINLDNILSGEDKDISLQQEDEVLVYEQARYVDQFKISIVGEVRSPFERAFAYDKGLTIKEALELAGGLKPEASKSGYIYRTDPFNAKKTTYLPVDINMSSSEKLMPGDQLVVFNKENYVFESSISISGDVNAPTTLRYDASLSIPDLIKIAGGLKVSSDPQYVEVFRLGFEVGKPPIRSLLKVDLNKNMEPVSGSFGLQPFDIIVIRKTPEFGLQELVTITGEVKKQGPFVLESKKYHFSDLIEDAGGFNAIADVYNTTLIRYSEEKGLIAFNAEDAMKFKRNLQKDPILLDRDYIVVPRQDNIVTIDPNGTNYKLAGGQKEINLTYQGTASAKWYVKKFGGGFAESKNKKYFRVIHQGGIQESTKEWLFFRNHPRVKPGDRVSIYYLTKEEKEKKEAKPFDWDKFVTRILALFTTLALIQAYVK